MTYVQAQMDAMNEGIAIGEARGMEKGRSEGAIQMLKALVQDGVLSIKEASKRANMTEKEFATLIAVQ